MADLLPGRCLSSAWGGGATGQRNSWNSSKAFCRLTAMALTIAWAGRSWQAVGGDHPRGGRGSPRRFPAFQRVGQGGKLHSLALAEADALPGASRAGTEQQPGGELDAPGRFGPEELDPHREPNQSPKKHALKIAIAPPRDLYETPCLRRRHQRKAFGEVFHNGSSPTARRPFPSSVRPQPGPHASSVRTRPQAAARMGKWKYLRDSGEEHLLLVRSCSTCLIETAGLAHSSLRKPRVSALCRHTFGFGPPPALQ